MKRTGYLHSQFKNHFAATVVFAALLASASSAVALMTDASQNAAIAAARAMPTVGRFVVTPNDAYFIPGRQTPTPDAE